MKAITSRGFEYEDPERIREFIAQNLDIKVSEVVDKRVLLDLSDSIDIFQLILSAEDTYSLEIHEDFYNRKTNVKDFIDYVIKNRNQ